MRITLTRNSFYCCCFLLLQFSNISHANEYFSAIQALPESNMDNNDVSLNKNTALNTTITPKDWSDSAIEHIAVTNKNVNLSPQVNDIFSVDNSKYLQHKIAETFKTGLYSLKNNYVLSSRSQMLNEEDFLVPNLAQQTLFQYGRFRTETGYNSTNNLNHKRVKSFLHGAYSLVNFGRFNLSVTASIESMEGSQNELQVKPLPTTNAYTSALPTTSTTIGVIGSFDLTNHWSVVGAITTSHVASTKDDFTLLNQSEQKVALIGTTYSF